MKLTEEEKEKAARCIVEAIEKDLRDRRGLRHEFEAIDADIQEEIREQWRALVRINLP